MCVGIEAIVGVMGAVASGMGAMQQANAAADAANYNAAIAARNSAIARENAADARRRGIAAEQEQQQKTQAMLGRQRAVMGDRMVDMGYGSSLDILGDTRMFGQLDALKIRDSFQREERAHLTEAFNFDAQSELSRMEADSHRQASGIAAFTMLADGFSSFRSLRIN